MKGLFGVFILTLSLSVFSSDKKEQDFVYKVSETATINWSAQKNWVFEPLLHADGLVITSVEENKDTSIVIQRTKLDHLTNKIFVKREWDSILKNTNSLDKSSNEKCNHHGVFYITCSRLLYLDKEKTYVVETFAWHEMTDLVVIQVRSKDKASALKDAVEIELKFKSKKVAKK